MSFASEVERHNAPGSVPISRPLSGDAWRVAVQFVDDPAVYSQAVTNTTLAGMQEHLPLTVDACGYRMRDLVRVTYTRL